MNLMKYMSDAINFVIYWLWIIGEWGYKILVKGTQLLFWIASQGLMFVWQYLEPLFIKLWYDVQPFLGRTDILIILGVCVVGSLIVSAVGVSLYRDKRLEILKEESEDRKRVSELRKLIAKYPVFDFADDVLSEKIEITNDIFETGDVVESWFKGEYLKYLTPEAAGFEDVFIEGEGDSS